MIIRKKFYSISEIAQLVGQHHPLVVALIRNARDMTIDRGNVVKERAELLDWLNSSVVGIATLENQYAESAEAPANGNRFMQVSFELESDLAMFLLRFT